MLFCLDESILSVTNDEKVKDALANLAMARKKGKHLIFAEKFVLEKLSNDHNLNERDRIIFKKLFQRSYKLKNYLNIFDIRVELISQENVIEKYNDSDGKEVIKLSIQYLEDPDLVSETMLLLEDENDYKLYGYIADYLLYQKLLTDIKVKFNLIPGAGSRIGDIFVEKAQTEQFFVLCIADTDKKSPHEKMGNTIKTLLKKYNKIKRKCLGKVYYGEYHEVENLIPPKIYEEYLGICYDEKQKYLESAQTCENKEKENIPLKWKEFDFQICYLNKLDSFKYFDYKRGITVSNFKNINGEKYWNSITARMNLNFDSNRYKPINEDNENIIVIEGFNNKIFDSVIDILKMTNIDEVKYIIMDEMKSDWEKVGKILISWGCCGLPIRIE